MSELTDYTLDLLEERNALRRQLAVLQSLLEEHDR